MMAQIDGINTPPRGASAQYMVLKIAERLPLVSGEMLDAADACAPYELLTRKLRVLHLQLVQLGDLAERAKEPHGPVLDMPHEKNKDSALKTPVDGTFHGSVERTCRVR